MISSQSQVCVNVSHNSIIARRRLCSKSWLDGKKVLSGVNKREERGREAATLAVAKRRKRQAEWEADAGPGGQRGEESGVSKTWRKIRSEGEEAQKKEREKGRVGGARDGGLV